MSHEPKPLSEWARKRAAGKARRARLIERREAYFDLLMSGYSVQQIGKAMDMSVAAVRRAIASPTEDSIRRRITPASRSPA
jgi:transposase